MIINSLWIGKTLGSMERLSICSHLRHGYEYHLWLYEPIDHVPAGTIVRNGREILPDDQLFCYQVGEEKGSYSAFSNIFRYKLLLEQGGWWCDTDVVCMKPFDFTEPYVFAAERYKTGSSGPTTCVIGVPAESNVMYHCWEKAAQVDRRTLRWGTIGPVLLMDAVFSNHLEQYVRQVNDFCPINWFDIQPLLAPGAIPDSYAIHLWNEMWRRNGFDKESDYPETLFDKLKSMYVV